VDKIRHIFIKHKLCNIEMELKMIKHGRGKSCEETKILPWRKSQLQKRQKWHKIPKS